MTYNVREVFRYFQERDVVLGFKPGVVKQETKLGLFAPSPLAPLEECVQALVQEKVLSSTGTMLDAGAGDGRVTALFGHLGFAAYGIESDEILAGLARQNIRKLQEAELVPVDATISHGDFTSASAYARLLMPFSQFDIVFNYQSNEERIAERIGRESRAGTVFLYATHGPWPVPFEKLNHEKTIAYPAEGLVTPIYLHVYKKVGSEQEPRRWARDARVRNRKPVLVH
jgi:SAM-dependent methyltransferase